MKAAFTNELRTDNSTLMWLENAQISTWLADQHKTEKNAGRMQMRSSQPNSMEKRRGMTRGPRCLKEADAIMCFACFRACNSFVVVMIALPLT